MRLSVDPHRCECSQLNPYKRYGHSVKGVYLYLLFVAIIAFLVNLTPSFWLEQLTASASSKVLSALGLISHWFVNNGVAYVQVAGGVRNITIEIVRECTGIHVIAIYMGLVLPVKSIWKKKILAITLASVMLFFLNITRVCLTIGLTFFEVFPFYLIFQNPTVETYHYPLSLLYGIFGVFLLIVSTDQLVIPELGDALVEVLMAMRKIFQRLYQIFRKRK